MERRRYSGRMGPLPAPVPKNRTGPIHRRSGSSATTTTPQTLCPFLLLPFELRLQIYELLLLWPTRILISHRRKQVHLPIADASRKGNDNPKPSDRLAVQLLRTCRQIDTEGTEFLYSRNSFLIGHRILLTRRASPSNDPQRPFSSAAYHPMFFFLLFLRRTTMQHIKSITFARSCQCGACKFSPVPFISDTSHVHLQWVTRPRATPRGGRHNGRIPNGWAGT
jgi:hypothetical protein